MGPLEGRGGQERQGLEKAGGAEGGWCQLWDNQMDS